MKFASSLLLAFLALPATALLAEEIDVEWGDVTVRIPVPEGFARIDGVNAEFDDIQASFIPPSNELLAMFATPADRQALESGNVPEMARTMNVQGLKQFKAANISERDFSALQAEIKKQYGNPKIDFDSALEAIEKSGASKLEEVAGDDANLDIGGIKPLGIFSEDENSTSFSMTFDVATEIEGKKEKSTMLATGAFVRLHGKVVNLYCNANGTTADDMKFAKNSLLSWKDRTLASNAALADVMAAQPTTDMGGGRKGGLKGLLKPALIGAVVGLGVALFLAFGKTKNA